QVREDQIQPPGARLQTSVNARYFSQIVRRFGLEGKAALVSARCRETVGASYPDLVQVAQRADVLLNISGILSVPELTQRVPIRVYGDLDPAFAQVWHTQGVDMGFDRHTHFVTIGLDIGKPTCLVPDCGREWIKTLQPILLEYWPVTPLPAEKALTTVG